MKRPLHQRLSRAIQLAWREIRGQRGAFDGAGVHRLLLDWIAQARSADDEIRGDLRLLRARARELGRNNSYVKRYFRLLVNNVIGPMGIKLQAQVWAGDQPDTKANTAIDAAWNAWANSPVTVDGKLTLRRFEKLVLKTVACDGEAFVRLWRGFEGNPHGLALQAIDADLIDETFNRPRRGTQNEIRMGVEIDAIGRAVGYWVWNAVGTDLVRERYFVSANEMLHLYDPERVNQTRGVTWVHAVMVPAHMLNAYEESEAVAARIGASKMGLFEKRADSLAGDLSSDPRPATMEANPGTFEIVPDGYEFKAWEPDHPTAQFPAFIKQMLRKIASGFSVFYNVLANDAEGVSYSTMRSFALVERDDWRSIQQDFIDMWRRPLYTAWLGMALLTGSLKLPSRDPARYMAVRHRPRGWQWIDPEKEARAAVISIQNGLGTRTGFLAEKGEDIEDVFAELAREKALAEEYGISVSGEVAASQKEPEDETDDVASGDDTGKKSVSAHVAR
ncbi:MAG: phage portal protein [bacterium]|nr:phage portal protein [bacterium]